MVVFASVHVLFPLTISSTRIFHQRARFGGCKIEFVGHIASVGRWMRSRLLMAFIALPSVLLLPACGGSGVTLPSPAPLSISVSPTQATVKAGSEFAFRA